MKRERRLKPGTLAVYYAKLRGNDPDIVIHNEAPARRADAHFMHSIFNVERYDYTGAVLPSLVDELKSRGYDIETLSFEIHMKEKV
jgi:hypothetical protein